MDQPKSVRVSSGWRSLSYTFIGNEERLTGTRTSQTPRGQNSGNSFYPLVPSSIVSHTVHVVPTCHAPTQIHAHEAVLHLPICAADTQLSRAHSTRCLHPTIPSTASTALDEGIPVLADGRCKVATCTLMGFTHQRRLSFQSDCIQDPFKVGDMFFTYFALTQTFTYYHVTECGLVVRLGDSIQAHQNNSQTLFNKIHRF